MSFRPKPIDVKRITPGTRADLAIPLSQDGLGMRIEAPFIVMRGREDGPVVGISAVVHGNELNGIRIIHGLVQSIDPRNLRGTLLCAPVVNVPAFHHGQRRFPEDAVDLNQVFPGQATGTPSQQYARAFLTTFLPPCDYLIDIHTASEGRLNTMYVRADWHSKCARRMAMLMHPQIILHGRSGDGTLRSAARRRDVPAITVEAGNPGMFQGRMVLGGETGVRRILGDLEMIRSPARLKRPPTKPAVVCSTSSWLRTTVGGLLDCKFDLAEQVSRGQVLANVVDAFGHPVESYTAPHDGVVIGMSQLPVAVPGTRFCHLGVIGEPEARSETKSRAGRAR